ncbi:nucleotidyltransferase domain-containing protein [Methylomonas sp. EFPC3]|uniref:nucleotidyltransferase domain-containing protein n=1 Tax=Methylomonas sp. EFPC3 TaxID=3021710 RepID=UPI002416F035|nr:nucleotidyltransferase domain-containing protein [Methylomonas sp. EFPC3]WFP49327.1 nucleotidyltransferase domain-containing protein [Methylomonas sp. EFPC3]
MTPLNSEISDRFGLKPHIISAIQCVFAKHPQVERAVLYGSRAKGNYRPGSDIDLTLLGESLTYADLCRIETEIDDLLLPYTLDLSLYAQIDNADLREHIRRVGQEFYSS